MSGWWTRSRLQSLVMRFKRLWGEGARMPFPKRVDGSQKEIVKTFRDMGCTVQILSSVGKGCPDILVGFSGANYLFELKDGTKCPSARKLTLAEQAFFEEWRGQVASLTSVDDVIIFLRHLTMNKLGLE